MFQAILFELRSEQGGQLFLLYEAAKEQIAAQ
jgi:hypothetical protein